MNKNKWLSAFLVTSLALTPTVASADSIGEHDANKKDPKQANEAPTAMVDKDQNKLYDNLEQKLEGKQQSDKLPVIIQFDTSNMPGKSSEGLDKKLKNQVGQYSTKHTYSVVDGIAATMNKKQIEKLKNISFVKQVELDVEVQMSNGTANHWFGTEKARGDFGLTGDGDGNPDSYSKDDYVVAVIDTGIDDSHVDLDEGKVLGWKDYVNGQTNPYDDQGHGTHVAGIAAGEGEADATYKGVAPEAGLVGIKVLDSEGSGSMSDIAAGVDWAVQNKDKYGIEVINLSLGSSASSDGTDTTSEAVNNAVDEGLVAMVAAGNSGPETYTVGSPGAAEKAITVGAAADPGEGGFNLADFSSRGYTADERIKPDIVAPGYNITAAEANTGNGYVEYSGTSMATPFTAGTALLLLDANPSLTPAQLESHLTGTAEDWGPEGKDIDYGHGLLDGYEAIESAGGLDGTNIDKPDHFFADGNLSGSGASDVYELDVTNTDYPVAVTMIMPDWASSWYSASPDFDVYVYDGSGNVVARAEGTERQETISFQPSSTGTYTVEVYSYSDSGDYFFDTSAGANNLTQTSDQ